MEEENIPRNFEDDLRNSNNPELRKSWEKVLKLKFGEGCEIIWKDNIEVQKGFGTDITIKTKQGRRYSVELKGRQNSCIGKDYIMEIKNHVYDQEEKEGRTHLNSYDGWIYTTTAEYIFHATLDKKGESIVECISYSLIPFKTEIWKSVFNNYETFFLPTRFNDGRFQWTINKLIPKEVIKKDAFDIIESWGFKYSTCGFNWVKKTKKGTGWHFGLGYWTRANSELCLIATKGKPVRQSASVSQVIDTPVQEHSKKPDCVRDKIVELMGDLPRIELFSRQKVNGWDVWGNEAEAK